MERTAEGRRADVNRKKIVTFIHTYIPHETNTGGQVDTQSLLQQRGAALTYLRVIENTLQEVPFAQRDGGTGIIYGSRMCISMSMWIWMCGQATGFASIDPDPDRG